MSFEVTHVPMPMSPAVEALMAFQASVDAGTAPRVRWTDLLPGHVVADARNEPCGDDRTDWSAHVIVGSPDEPSVDFRAVCIRVLWNGFATHCGVKADLPPDLLRAYEMLGDEENGEMIVVAPDDVAERIVLAWDIDWQL